MATSVFFCVFSLLVTHSFAYTNVVCPKDSPLCGLLTLESGLAQGFYNSSGIHGLWPEVAPFGNSLSITPTNANFDAQGVLNGPAKRPGCNSWAELRDGQPWFAEHEWTSHGVHAGSEDSVAFFNNACDLATGGEDGGPLGVLVSAVSSSDKSWVKVQSMMRTNSNYGKYIVTIDEENDQVELGVCAKCAGTAAKPSAPCVWSLCELKAVQPPGPPISPTATPTPHPTPSPGQCLKDQHGPPCTHDGDCSAVPGCVRCAHSGYCTDVPLIQRITQSLKSARRLLKPKFSQQ
mmetsp:Transcript_8035/g.9322  ORF Transcript_8035/g.9322 Transcript_8035/m.9322 type:complete len:291 (+) Transcript_8035:228-1100(+)|eukprot:CAMPEP_0197854848 /NCGR_PEP_ID=MMETSP1438-20131217/25442_1 /TAXON_ID=1461541 /ORGANISM="Pterosperma sp., Strain CCMP1384" /LENGTH=290 /DNA_ID=CAMNT_0043469739 /DNA_START=228 /DNA_END=1100 /DNA_ORIENTATION=+